VQVPLLAGVSQINQQQCTIFHPNQDMESYNQLHSTSMSENVLQHEREKESRVFDETKAGIKGLVDAGIQKIPAFFVEPEDVIASIAKSLEDSSIQVAQMPVIDLKCMHEDIGGRKAIIKEVKNASETWGFFQIINHGVPLDVMEEMIEGVRQFHEQNVELKMKYHTIDIHRKVIYNNNFDLYTRKVMNWRDTLCFFLPPGGTDPEEFPPVCREITVKYIEHMKQLGNSILELLAEALGLKPNHLIDMDCGKGNSIICHYYPPCPEPNRTFGTRAHKDFPFFNILQQDQVGGLQVYHQQRWCNLISNDKFKSVEHR
ncbi:hypothetical protein Tsubulata_021277, partial [Turnera subulata]